MNSIIWTKKDEYFAGTVAGVEDTTLFVIFPYPDGFVLSGAPIPDASDGAHYSTLEDAKAAAESHLGRWTGRMSDGFHTFAELYDHRHALFLALMKSAPEISWISAKHNDGTMLDGWFIAGMHLPTGDVTYHLPIGLWSRACETGVKIIEAAPAWDGHTSKDVVDRLHAWTGCTVVAGKAVES